MHHKHVNLVLQKRSRSKPQKDCNTTEFDTNQATTRPGM